MSTDDKWRQQWRPERIGGIYGDVMYRRAVGEMPTMESTKAAASRLRPILRDGDRLLDVGCGVGHYLRGLREILTTDVDYTGVDPTPNFLELARKAYAGQKNVRFVEGDVFALPFDDAKFDVAMSNNVLLHLPSIRRPIAELCRVARRQVVFRTLIGERSFRIQEVHGPDESFDEQGEPASFNYFNIYSRAYVDALLRSTPHARRWSIDADDDFDPSRMIEEKRDRNHPTVTTMAGKSQVNGYILLPWAFVTVEVAH